jgi:hypothetical protein
MIETLKTIDTSTIYAIGAFIGVMLYSRLDHIKKTETKRVEGLRQKNPDHRTLSEYYKRTKKLDPTKRKSLQPSNQVQMPTGWNDEDEIRWKKEKAAHEQVQAPKSEPSSTTVGHPRRQKKNGVEFVHPDEYFHKFFGGRLVMDGHELLTGLSNGLHKLEITKDNKIYVDGKPLTINPTTLERLKEALDTTQGK